MSIIERLIELKAKARRKHGGEEFYLRATEDIEGDLACLRYDDVGPLATEIVLKGPEAAIGASILGMTVIWRALPKAKAVEEDDLVVPFSELNARERADLEGKGRKVKQPPPAAPTTKRRK